MRNKKKCIRLLALLTCTITLYGCSKEEAEILTDTTEIVEQPEEIKDTNKNKKDKDKKDDKKDNSVSISMLVDDTDGMNIELQDPANLELAEAPQYTSGKVIDTSGNFDIYELEVDDSNDTLQLFDGDYAKYMYDLNDYVIQLVHIKLNRITRYISDDDYMQNYDTTVEYDIEDVQILLRGIDAKHAVVNSYFAQDIDLVTAWNSFYQEVSLITPTLEELSRTNCNTIDISKVSDTASILSEILYIRTANYTGWQ